VASFRPLSVTRFRVVVGATIEREIEKNVEGNGRFIVEVLSGKLSQGTEEFHKEPQLG